MTASNLAAMFDRADLTDRQEGMLAYPRYRLVLERIADRYAIPLPRVIAAFAALSPNSDYFGNLRSLVSVLEGHKAGLSGPQIVVSTYGHCRDRALQYIRGEVDFLETVRGMKIRSFYHNILQPYDQRHVTIDGHMYATWVGKAMTMKEAIVRRGKLYTEIADTVKALAFREFLIPCQYQAIIWFARKRTLRVRFEPQLGLFGSAGDQWQTLRDLSEITPYEASHGQLHDPLQRNEQTDDRTAKGHSSPRQYAVKRRPHIVGDQFDLGGLVDTSGACIRDHRGLLQREGD